MPVQIKAERKRRMRGNTDRNGEREILRERANDYSELQLEQSL